MRIVRQRNRKGTIDMNLPEVVLNIALHMF
jgi:hypothetical protein